MVDNDAEANQVVEIIRTRMIDGYTADMFRPFAEALFPPNLRDEIFEGIRETLGKIYDIGITQKFDRSAIYFKYRTDAGVAYEFHLTLYDSVSNLLHNSFAMYNLSDNSVLNPPIYHNEIDGVEKADKIAFDVINEMYSYFNRYEQQAAQHPPGGPDPSTLQPPPLLDRHQQYKALERLINIVNSLASRHL